MIQQVLATSDSIKLLKELQVGQDEGVMVVKFVLLKQATLSNDEAQSKIDSAPSIILLGNLDEMKSELTKWLGEAITQYRN